MVPLPHGGERHHYITTAHFILAPILGFQDEISLVLSGTVNYIDFTSRNGNGHHRSWRIYVDRSQVTQDPLNPTIFYITPRAVVRLYSDGSEGPSCNGQLYLNTEVTVKGALAGVLTIWVPVRETEE